MKKRTKTILSPSGTGQSFINEVNINRKPGLIVISLNFWRGVLKTTWGKIMGAILLIIVLALLLFSYTQLISHKAAIDILLISLIVWLAIFVLLVRKELKRYN